MGLVGFESAPRYRELLYKLISEDLEFPPPGFTIESDRPEWSFLKDEVLWQVQPVVQAAVAAQLGFLQIFNPANSGRIAVILGFTINKTGAGFGTEALTTTVRGASGSTTAVPRDTRWNPPVAGGGALTAREALSITIGTTVGFGTDIVIGQFQIGTTPTDISMPPVILAPGTGWVIAGGTVNEAVTFDRVFGYSRQARPEELTL